MNRTAVIAVAGAAALLLAGCSSSSGTPVAISTTSSVAAVSSAPASSAPASSSLASSAPASSSPMSSASPSSAPESSAPISSAPDSTAPDSTAPDSTAPDSTASESSTPASSSTASGALDAPTTEWFGAFCGGLTPFFSNLKDVQEKEKGVSATDYPAQQKLFVSLLKAGSTQLSDVGGKLKDLPVPTFTGGSAFATKTVAVFSAAGPAFTAAAKKLSAASATKASLTAASGTLEEQVKGVAGQISAVGVLNIPDTTKRKLLLVPACAKLQSIVTG